MAKQALIWVDLTHSGSTLERAVAADCQPCTIHRVRRIQDIDANVQSSKPLAACFEYDYPDSAGLTALSETKVRYPVVPIVMITTYHSAMLAVWALRSRVWDILVKPCSAADLRRRLESLSRLARPERHRRSPREMVLPVAPIQGAPAEPRQGRNSAAILEAQRYIEQHLDQKIAQTEIARHCGLSRSHFSRVFRQMCGMGFSEFVVQSRIRRALRLLQAPEATVENVCFEVGFQDVSYFGRMFRRYVGISPSGHRRAYLACEHTRPSLPAPLLDGSVLD